MSPDQVEKLILDMADVKAALPYIKGDIDELKKGLADHGTMLTSIVVTQAQILERLPERRSDHRRDDDPPEGKGWPWGVIAKIGGGIGAVIGSAYLTVKSGAAEVISKMMGGQ